ncbi:MAG: UPF0280 family protein [Clostridia bacterium]|nr:UPF0280 family protein [Clostridia bacterium]
MKADIYEERYYRRYVAPEQIQNFNITIFESDLQIYTDGDLEDVLKVELKKLRETIEAYIQIYPEFNASLKPIKVLPSDPLIIKHMKEASKKLGVGPMATVAGAVSHYLGLMFYKETKELIIENGGDLFVYSIQNKRVLLHGGAHSKVNNLSIEIDSNELPIGICTSSGKLGHSLSFGKCDAVTVISKDTLVADAAATAFGNLLIDKSKIKDVLNYSRTFKDISGVIAIVDDQMGAWGNFEFV